jgi:hypothetical protein
MIRREVFSASSRCRWRENEVSVAQLQLGFNPCVRAAPRFSVSKRPLKPITFERSVWK